MLKKKISNLLFMVTLLTLFLGGGCALETDLATDINAKKETESENGKEYIGGEKILAIDKDKVINIGVLQFADIPVVFAAVTDPLRAGVVDS